MRAVCTWGDGPDVLVDLDNTTIALYEAPWSDPPPRGRWAHGCISKGSFDLTSEEAEKLGYELIAAAEQSKELDKSFSEHCTEHHKKQMELDMEKTMEWNNIKCESCGEAHHTVECDKTYKLKP